MSDRESYRARREDLITFGLKSPYLTQLGSEILAKCQSLGIKDRQQTLEYLEQLWLPLALNLATKREQLRTPIQGILGGQGTGKTTLCVILKLILNYLGFSTASLSIDDLYLTHAQRQKLKQQDPRLIWRGPPGTHDIDLGLQVIEQCLQADDDAKILMPRFDKSAFNGSGDRITAEAIVKPDILLFEGWFMGVQPVFESSFNNPPAPIITPEDIQFAKDNNQRLKAYLPLWNKLDSLIILHPEDYRLSKQWRKEAEHKMIAKGKTGMSDEEIDRFVEYFWKSLHPELFIKPLTQSADLVVEIKSDRSLGKVY